MDRNRAISNQGSGEHPDPGGRSPGRQFASEMAFQPRFQGRRWTEVEVELREAYPDWLKAHNLAGAGGTAWDDVKRDVRVAWESALDVERMETHPWTGQWDERASEYRHVWQGRYASTPGRRWETDEIGFRYADSMAMDPQFVGRPWDDIGPGLQAGFPTWAASHGYRVAEGETTWEHLRDVIRHAWEHMTHRHSQTRGR